MKGNKTKLPKKSSVVIFGIFIILLGSTISTITVNAIRPTFPTYTGYVKNTSGTPLQNAYVRLYSNGVQVSSDYTDSNGYYCVGCEYVSSPYLKVEKSGYLTQTKYVSTLGGKYNFYLQSNVLPTYAGYVRNNQGYAIQNAIVRLYSGGYQVSIDYTDSNGYYCVGNDYVTSPYLKVEKDGYVPQTQSVSSNGGTYNFYLGVYYALIVGGETEERFTRDAFGMYNTLMDHYSFTDDRIYLITTRTTIDGNTVPRDRATSRANVEWAIQQISYRSYSRDQIVIWWTGHGSVDSFATDSDSITSTQFDNCLDDISCKQMFIFLGPCHSGSFIDNLDDEQNRAIYTSCTSSQSGYLSSDYAHSLYPWATYRGLDPDLNADDADTNNDDKVSLYELFNYCVDFVDDNTSYSQDPQRWVGSSIYDSGEYIGDQKY